MKMNEIISCFNEKIKQISVTGFDEWLLNPIYSAIDEIKVKNKALEIACEEYAKAHGTTKKEAEELLIQKAKHLLNIWG